MVGEQERGPNELFYIVCDRSSVKNWNSISRLRTLRFSVPALIKKQILFYLKIFRYFFCSHVKMHSFNLHGSSYLLNNNLWLCLLKTINWLIDWWKIVSTWFVLSVYNSSLVGFRWLRMFCNQVYVVIKNSALWTNKQCLAVHLLLIVIKVVFVLFCFVF